MKNLLKLFAPIALGSLFLLSLPAQSAAADNLALDALNIFINNALANVVVVDKDKVIIADTVPANVGTKYNEDKGDEVKQTLKDKKPRSFTEKSKDYPNGLQEKVYAIGDKSGNVTGAFIISDTPVRQKVPALPKVTP